MWCSEGLGGERLGMGAWGHGWVMPAWGDEGRSLSLAAVTGFCREVAVLLGWVWLAFGVVDESMFDPTRPPVNVSRGPAGPLDPRMWCSGGIGWRLGGVVWRQGEMPGRGRCRAEGENVARFARGAGGFRLWVVMVLGACGLPSAFDGESSDDPAHPPPSYWRGCAPSTPRWRSEGRGAGVGWSGWARVGCGCGGGKIARIARGAGGGRRVAWCWGGACHWRLTVKLLVIPPTRLVEMRGHPGR
jgi:hypothetical protein